MNSGLFLYFLCALFIFLFWSRVRGLTFDEILRRSRLEHEHVKKILGKHPHGGTWKEMKHWLKGENE